MILFFFFFNDLIFSLSAFKLFFLKRYILYCAFLKNASSCYYFFLFLFSFKCRSNFSKVIYEGLNQNVMLNNILQLLNDTFIHSTLHNSYLGEIYVPILALCEKRVTYLDILVLIN